MNVEAEDHPPVRKIVSNWTFAKAAALVEAALVECAEKTSESIPAFSNVLVIHRRMDPLEASKFGYP